MTKVEKEQMQRLRESNLTLTFQIDTLTQRYQVMTNNYIDSQEKLTQCLDKKKVGFN